MDKRISYLILLVFSISTFLTDLIRCSEVYASEINLPVAGTLVPLSETYNGSVLKGIELNPNNPLSLSFVIDTQDNSKTSKTEISKLISYFMAALAIDKDNIWVNLSPYEQNRITDDNLAVTDLGKDLLEQDYILKQLSASLTHPDSKLGQEYWNSSSSQDSLDKIWIMPTNAQIYETETGAFVNGIDFDVETKSEITDDNSLTGLIKEIKEDVNSGKNFTNLRQIYHSVVLAQWFKQKLKDTFFKQYIDQNNISGIDLEDKSVKDKIWAQYNQSFKQGAYNIIKKVRSAKGQLQKQKFFAGGVTSSSLTVEKNITLPKFKGEAVRADIILTNPDGESYSSSAINFQLIRAKSSLAGAKSDTAIAESVLKIYLQSGFDINVVRSQITKREKKGIHGYTTTILKALKDKELLHFVQEFYPYNDSEIAKNNFLRGELWHKFIEFNKNDTSSSALEIADLAIPVASLLFVLLAYKVIKRKVTDNGSVELAKKLFEELTDKYSYEGVINEGTKTPQADMDIHNYEMSLEKMSKFHIQFIVQSLEDNTYTGDKLNALIYYFHKLERDLNWHEIKDELNDDDADVRYVMLYLLRDKFQRGHTSFWGTDFKHVLNEIKKHKKDKSPKVKQIATEIYDEYSSSALNIFTAKEIAITSHNPAKIYEAVHFLYTKGIQLDKFIFATRIEQTNDNDLRHILNLLDNSYTFTFLMESYKPLTKAFKSLRVYTVTKSADAQGKPVLDRFPVIGERSRFASLKDAALKDYTKEITVGNKKVQVELSYDLQKVIFDQDKFNEFLGVVNVTNVRQMFDSKISEYKKRVELNKAKNGKSSSSIGVVTKQLMVDINFNKYLHLLDEKAYTHDPVKLNDIEKELGHIINNLQNLDGFSARTFRKALESQDIDIRTEAYDLLHILDNKGLGLNYILTYPKLNSTSMELERIKVLALLYEIAQERSELERAIVIEKAQYGNLDIREDVNSIYGEEIIKQLESVKRIWPNDKINNAAAEALDKISSSAIKQGAKKLYGGIRKLLKRYFAVNELDRTSHLPAYIEAMIEYLENSGDNIDALEQHMYSGFYEQQRPNVRPVYNAFRFNNDETRSYLYSNIAEIHKVVKKYHFKEKNSSYQFFGVLSNSKFWKDKQITDFTPEEIMKMVLEDKAASSSINGGIDSSKLSLEVESSAGLFENFHIENFNGFSFFIENVKTIDKNSLFN